MYNSFSCDHRTSDSVDQSIYSGAVRCEKSAFNLTSQNIAGSLLQYTLDLYEGWLLLDTEIGQRQRLQKGLNINEAQIVR